MFGRRKRVDDEQIRCATCDKVYSVGDIRFIVRYGEMCVSCRQQTAACLINHNRA